jgi:hypothetical protein
MGQMFNTLEDACIWLVVKGWRQNYTGAWFKGDYRMEIRHSPINDGAVCLVKVSDTYSDRSEFDPAPIGWATIKA